MVYGYTRVSTKKQLTGYSLEDQAAAILAEYPGSQIIAEQYSGARTAPMLADLIDKIQPGDKLVVTKLDRLCRTTQKGLKYIEMLRDKGATVHILDMGLIEDTPTGNFILTLFLAFAQFERAQIIERMQAGKAIAKKRPGFREGRPKKYSRTQIQHALELLETHSYTQVEEMTGISKSTLQRARREAKKRTPDEV